MLPVRSATIATLLLAALACDKGPSRTTTVAATVATSVDSSKPAGEVTAPAGSRPLPPAPVSYEDAEAAYQTGQYADAAELFAAYTEQKPDNPWGRYMLGLSAWKAGDLARAETAFDEALTLDPTHLKSMLNSTRVLLERDRGDEALERIDAAVDIAPQSGEAFRLRGRALAQLGQNDEAIEAYQRAAALNEEDGWAMNNLGLLYIQLGRYTEALPPLARATEIKPRSPVFQNNLGQALERLGHVSKAKQAYEAALASDSGYAKASTGLARVNGLADTPEVADVDLKALADEFRTTVQQWAFVARDTLSDVADSVQTQ
ncbi:MAG: tetratricopeptide repeat protein [Gemmatimonadales bacterium]